MIESNPATSIRLRPLGQEDRPLIGNWARDSAVRAWWGSPAALEAEIAIALESDSAICRMMEAEGAAIGYCHAFDTGLMDTQAGARSEPGIWQCTFFIGSEAHRGRGIGVVALDLLAHEVLSTTLAIGCETRVPVRNESAVREIEDKGFRWRRIEHDDALGPYWILRRERNP